MKIFQMMGLSGAGKSTVAEIVKTKLLEKGHAVAVLDGDEFRKNLCPDLGFSKAHRLENIRRMGYVAHLLAQNQVIVIIAAINPYNEMRKELAEKYLAKTIFVDCDIPTLLERDTKGLYKRAFLPIHHPDYLANLTGINADFEIPIRPDLVLNTSSESIEESSEKLLTYILKCLI
jgi:adenylylsulfate kinase